MVNYTSWHQGGRFDTSSLWSQMRHYYKIKMKINTQKKKKNLLDAIFFPPKQKYKKVFFSNSSADHRGRRSVLCAKRLFSLLSEGFMSLKDPGCPDLSPKAGNRINVVSLIWSGLPPRRVTVAQDSSDHSIYSRNAVTSDVVMSHLVWSTQTDD